MISMRETLLAILKAFLRVETGCVLQVLSATSSCLISFVRLRFSMTRMLSAFGIESTETSGGAMTNGNVHFTEVTQSGFASSTIASDGSSHFEDRSLIAIERLVLWGGITNDPMDRLGVRRGTNL